MASITSSFAWVGGRPELLFRKKRADNIDEKKLKRKRNTKRTSRGRPKKTNKSPNRKLFKKINLNTK